MYGLKYLFVKYGIESEKAQEVLLKIFHLTGSFYPNVLGEDLKNAGFNNKQTHNLLNCIAYSGGGTFVSENQFDDFDPQQILSFKDFIHHADQVVSQEIKEQQEEILEKILNWLDIVMERTFRIDTAWKETFKSQIAEMESYLGIDAKIPKKQTYDGIIILGFKKSELPHQLKYLDNLIKTGYLELKDKKASYISLCSKFETSFSAQDFSFPFQPVVVRNIQTAMWVGINRSHEAPKAVDPSTESKNVNIANPAADTHKNFLIVSGSSSFNKNKEKIKNFLEEHNLAEEEESTTPHFDWTKVRGYFRFSHFTLKVEVVQGASHFVNANCLYNTYQLKRGRAPLSNRSKYSSVVIFGGSVLAMFTLFRNPDLAKNVLKAVFPSIAEVLKIAGKGV